MATARMSEADVRMRDAVRCELDWDAEVDASGIGVAARNDAVTLTGYIDTYAGKLAAERAAKRIEGVRAVANDLQVRLKIARADTDIAQDAARALELCATLPAAVQATVHDGHVTLTGPVTWMFQKWDAENAVRRIGGVRGVFNHLVATPAKAPRDVQRRIAKALHLNADIDARHITAVVTGSTVSLTGSVGSWLQREAAERAAASAPGIAHVENHLVVDPLAIRRDELAGVP